MNFPKLEIDLGQKPRRSKKIQEDPRSAIVNSMSTLIAESMCEDCVSFNWNSSTWLEVTTRFLWSIGTSHSSSELAKLIK